MALTLCHSLPEQRGCWKRPFPAPSVPVPPAEAGAELLPARSLQQWWGGMAPGATSWLPLEQPVAAGAKPPRAGETLPVQRLGAENRGCSV